MIKHIVKQQNRLTDARYVYTVNEKRIIYYVMFHIKAKLNEGVSEDLFNKDTLYVTIPEATIKELHPDADNAARDMRKAVKLLRTRAVSYNTENGWVENGMISGGKYNNKKGLDIEISRDVAPLYVEVAKEFTAFSATVAISLQSSYTQRFYEFCSRWKDTGWFEFTPEELAYRFEMEGERTNDLKKLIERAKKELADLFASKQGDLFFTYEEKRSRGRGRGGKIEKWRFKVVSDRHDPEKEKEERNREYTFVLQFLKDALKNEKRVNKAMTGIVEKKVLTEVSDQFLKMNERMNKIDNLGGVVHSMLKKEFDIDIFKK